jgi:general secretion pathway protein B
MSFILDALKKSETDRQRQNGPALFEVKVAPPRTGLPLWAVALAALLAVNLVIVAWVLLRRPAPPAEAAAAPAPAAAPGTAPGAAATVSSAGGAGAAAPPGGPQGQPKPQDPAPNAVPVSGNAPGSSLGQTAGMTQPAPTASAGAPETPQPVNANPGAAGGGLVARADSTTDKGNPDDYAPAAEPGIVPGFGNHVSHGTESGLPLYQDAALAQGAHIPELRLDLHVFAAKPQDRFVMINMKKLHEGDSLPQGVRVESITPDGAVLSHNGAKFLLPRD